MLYEGFMTPCTRLSRTRVADGEGGWETGWEAGGAFEAAIVLDSDVAALMAERQGSERTFTVITAAALSFHEAFTRDSDSTGFRVVGVLDPAPGAATFAFNRYRCEEWERA